MFASTKNIFSEIGARQVKLLPIKNSSVIEENFIVEKVNDMLTLNKLIQEHKTTFLNRLKQNLNLKKFSSFNNIGNLDFKEFLIQLKKQKIKLSLSDQDTWEKYFLEKKKEIQINLNKLEQIDKEIDKIIYKIYNLTENEISLIEKR